MTERNQAAPRVGDRVRVGGGEFEIRAIIAEEGSIVLTELAEGRRRPGLWLLWGAEFTPVAPGLWEATNYRTIQRAEAPGEEGRRP